MSSRKFQGLILWGQLLKFITKLPGLYGVVSLGNAVLIAVTSILNVSVPVDGWIILELDVVPHAVTVDLVGVALVEAEVCVVVADVLVLEVVITVLGCSAVVCGAVVLRNWENHIYKVVQQSYSTFHSFKQVAFTFGCDQGKLIQCNKVMEIYQYGSKLLSYILLRNIFENDFDQNYGCNFVLSK